MITPGEFIPRWKYNPLCCLPKGIEYPLPPETLAFLPAEESGSFTGMP